MSDTLPRINGNGAQLPWPVDEIKRWPLANLTPYTRNTRLHSDEQIGQIVASIRQWGWTNPILVDEDGSIIAGHARVMAAERLAIADVPVMVARGWTDAQKNAYTIADNKLTENGRWDVSLLRLEVADLSGLGFDMSLLGFSAAELKAFTWPGQEVIDPQAEWDGMPEFEQDAQKPFREIMVRFRDQEAVDAFSRLIEQTITSQTRSLWCPKLEHEPFMHKRYASENA